MDHDELGLRVQTGKDRFSVLDLKGRHEELGGRAINIRADVSKTAHNFSLLRE